MALHADVLLRSDTTGDALSVVEIHVPPRWEGPPLHRHAFAEAFYVLDGELTFQLDGGLVTRGPGALTFAPGDAVHTLANLADRPAGYLLVCTPGGFERRFDAGLEGPVHAGRPELETHVVGPTIAQHLAARGA